MNWIGERLRRLWLRPRPRKCRSCLPRQGRRFDHMAGMNMDEGSVLDGWSHVCQSVHILFTTEFFARGMRAYVGSNVIRLLGELTVPQTVQRIRTAIAIAIDLFEPRLDPYKVDLVAMDGTGK